MKSRFVLLPLALALSLGTAVPSHAISLKEAVRIAVQENPNGTADAANLRAVAGELKESQTTFAPSIDVFGDAAAQRRESPTASSVGGSGTRTLLSREIGIRTSFLLYDGLERANNVYRNAARLDEATFRLLSTSETLALSAVEAYIDVIRHRKLFAATQSNIRRHREILQQIKERVEGGTSPLSDQIQIEERVFAAEAVSIEVKKALQDANIKFKKTVGRNPGKKMHLHGIKGLPRSLGSLVAASVANNYTIKQADLNITSNEFAREAARSGNKPRVSVDGRASVAADRTGTRGNESDLYLGLTLSWRLYDGGLVQARERTSSDRIAEAQARRDVTVLDVKALAERSWNSYRSGLERSAVLRNQLQTNERIVSSYREEYTLSKRSLLDVLDAERARFNNEFQQISVSASASFSAYRMLASMSRLTRHFGIQPIQLAPTPRAVETFTSSSPNKIFNIDIAPLD